MIIDPDSAILGRAPGLPDDVFDHDGLVTKRIARAAALAHLRPRPGELLWDVGTGAGSVGIEWARADASCRVLTVDNKAARTDRARGNAERLCAPGQVEFYVGDALAVLGDWVLDGRTPAAVFIGGGASEDVLELCWEALGVDGRLVLHGVTMETETLAVWAFRRWGGTLQRIAVETNDRIGTMSGWSPARTIVAWSVEKWAVQGPEASWETREARGRRPAGDTPNVPSSHG